MQRRSDISLRGGDRLWIVPLTIEYALLEDYLRVGVKRSPLQNASAEVTLRTHIS